MALVAGFEPAFHRLTAERVAFDHHTRTELAGTQGFEPRFCGSEPHVLPLDDVPKGEKAIGSRHSSRTRTYEMVGGKRFELSLARFRSEVLYVRRTPDGWDGGIRTPACVLPKHVGKTRLPYIPTELGVTDGSRTRYTEVHSLSARRLRSVTTELLSH